MEKPLIILTHLYDKELSIYGDIGNLITMTSLLEAIGCQVRVHNVSVGDSLPFQTDWYFIGGGADRDQADVASDLLQKKDTLLDEIMYKNIPMLAICGGYQLLGQQFVTANGNTLPGIALFPITTEAPSNALKDRCVGNIVARSLHPEITGDIVGFENHSGQTRAASSKFSPLARVKRGNGNSWRAQFEGCVWHNAIGSYFHGPCLAKNPAIALFFVRTILKNRRLLADYSTKLDTLNLDIESALHNHLVTRFK